MRCRPPRSCRCGRRGARRAAGRRPADGPDRHGRSDGRARATDGGRRGHRGRAGPGPDDRWPRPRRAPPRCDQAGGPARPRPSVSRRPVPSALRTSWRSSGPRARSRRAAASASSCSSRGTGVMRRIWWERCVAEMRAGRLDPDAVTDFARLHHAVERADVPRRHGWLPGRRARHRGPRCGGAPGRAPGAARGRPEDTATTTRLRRVATRHGLNPDGDYRLIAIAPRPEADPIPERPGIGDEELEVLAGRIGHLLGSTAPGAEGVGAGIRLPAVLPLHGRIAVLARADWAGLARVPSVLDRSSGALRPPRPRRRAGARSTRRRPAGLGRGRVGGGRRRRGRSATTYADIVDATRTARRLGLRGWIPDPRGSPSNDCCSPTGRSPTPRSSRSWARSSPTSAWARELVETLQAYFDAGENMREAARRLNLATRTVAYRLEKIESLLGEPIGPSAAAAVDCADGASGFATPRSRRPTIDCSLAATDRVRCAG